MPDKVNPTYRKKIEDIKVKGENVANSQMKDVYLEQKQALDELHKLIGKIYIDYSQDGFLKLDSQQKSKVTDDIKKHLKEMGINLSQSEVAKVSEILGAVFATTYYENAYVMELGMTTDIKFNILKKEFIEKAVSQVYKGEMFSDRIWKNKASMIDQLQSSIIEAMKGNITIDKVGRNIRDTFNVSAYESKRLVLTETARIQSQAQLQIGLDSGVKQVMWSATLDSETNPEDASLDGKVWGINEDHPVPPLHPNCRCVLINVPYVGWSPTARKDNQTKGIIDYTDYTSWAKSKKITND